MDNIMKHKKFQLTHLLLYSSAARWILFLCFNYIVKHISYYKPIFIKSQHFFSKKLQHIIANAPLRKPAVGGNYDRHGNQKGQYI